MILVTDSDRKNEFVIAEVMTLFDPFTMESDTPIGQLHSVIKVYEELVKFIQDEKLSDAWKLRPLVDVR